MRIINGKTYYTVPELSEIMLCSKNSIWRYIRIGKIKNVIKFGNNSFIPEDEIKNFQK